MGKHKIIDNQTYSSTIHCSKPILIVMNQIVHTAFWDNHESEFQRADGWTVGNKQIPSSTTGNMSSRQNIPLLHCRVSFPKDTTSAK